MNQSSRLTRLAISAAILVLGAAAGIWATWTADGPRIHAAAPAAPVLRTDAIARVARDRSASVVYLHTLERPQGSAAVRSGTAAGEWEEALGSGVVIEKPGLILTNAHVIENAEAIHVRTPDGDDTPVTVVGVDRTTDLALLRASDATGLVPAPLGDSDRTTVGEWVIAIGNPYGLHHTVTAGIVSAKARQLDDEGIELLQTDASINPGNSGGALFNLRGEVIGITSGLISQKGESVGLNFAIPINTAKEILPQLRTGSVVHGWIGLTAGPLGRRQAIAAGLTVATDGLRVTGLAPGSPAERAGLRLGDILLGVMDQPSMTAREILHRIQTGKPGTIVPLRVLRAGQRMAVSVTLAAVPPRNEPK